MNKLNNGLFWVLGVMILPAISFAEEGMGVAVSPWIAPAIGFGLAFAVIAGTTAQGRIAASFMEGTSRNPGAADGMRTPLLLSLAFVESLVLFTVLIAFMLLGKM